MTSEDFYRILLKAYPARYRSEYGEPMAQCFRDLLRAADTPVKKIRLWSRTIVDLAITIPACHLELDLRRPRTFDHYSKRAKHAIFFARYEAECFSALEITLEHLLLGILREDHALARNLLTEDGLNEIIRTVLGPQAHRPRRPRVSRKLPLNSDFKNALKDACQAAERSQTEVGTRHLLTGILRQETSVAARLLRQHSRDLSSLGM